MGKSHLRHGASLDLGVSTTAIARNAPCPCGSGKRFKDCHGSSRSPSRAPASADALLASAQVAFAAGRSSEALATLRTALELDPARADLRRECARIEWTVRDPGAESTCRAALELGPDDVRSWNLLGEILLNAEPSAAEAAWRKALEFDHDNAEALFHLANRLRERGNEIGRASCR